MSESVHVTLERVSPEEIAEFQEMVELYWQELMPYAPVIQEAEQRKAYFGQCFTWKGGDRHPLWAIVGGRRVGFVSFEVSLPNKSARVEDFYVALTERRKGYGSAMVRAICTHLDQLGIELIELNVRRDNPVALSFWEAQGFRIALYRLRQYRDPQRGIGFIGGLSSDFATDAEDTEE
jgi:ribosomal protein S18 acetylase RimI-like enzyme